MKKTTTNILTLLFLFILTSCKKYPENNLWFKNPEKLDPFVGHISEYSVNGIDSLGLMQSYFGNSYGIVKDLRSAYIETQHQYAGLNQTQIFFGTSGASEVIYYELTNKKKFMTINCTQDTNVIKKNLFIDRNVKWQIMRLGKKPPFKIKTTLDNGNTYEIEITK